MTSHARCKRSGVWLLGSTKNLDTARALTTRLREHHALPADDVSWAYCLLDAFGDQGADLLLPDSGAPLVLEAALHVCSEDATALAETWRDQQARHPKAPRPGSAICRSGRPPVPCHRSEIRTAHCYRPVTYCVASRSAEE